MVAFLFPGQGSQYPGMIQDLYKDFAVVRRAVEEASDVLKMDAAHFLFASTAEELTRTDKSQLAIYLSSMAIFRALAECIPELQPVVCAGLSLGEYTALTASGKMSFAEGLLLVKARGEYMQEACLARKGFMAAVLGLDCSAVACALQEVCDVWVANINCPGQVVIAGDVLSMEKAVCVLKEKGAKKLIPLDVAGAFHTQFMKSAQEKLRLPLETLHLQETKVDIVMNAVGDFVTDLSAIRDLLIAQVVSPVLWQAGILAMESHGILLYVEVGCGKTLSGMNRKIGVQGKTLSIGSTADIVQLEEEYAAFKK